MNSITCSCCGFTGPELPRDNWRGFKDRIKFVCKSCYYREYKIRNKDRIRERQNAWVRANPEKPAAAWQKYVDSGKRTEAYYNKIASNPEYYSLKAVERAHKAKALNPEKYRSYQRTYHGVRRRQVENATIDFSWDGTLQFYKETPEGRTVDHIIPLKHPLVSGLHVPWNMQYLTKSENSKKSNSFDGTRDNNTWRRKKLTA